jgi:predicted anti-sigma-YlaC factor YlaD
MPHLPFEEWLFSEEDLSKIQQQALQDHLRNCPGCRQLARRRDESQAGLQQLTVTPPPGGFLERWRQLRQQREMQLRLWHAWLVLALCGVGALVLAVILGWQLAALLLSPVRLLLELGRLSASLATQVSMAEVLGTVLLQGAQDLIPVPLWAGLVLSLGLLSALWVHILLRLNAQGVQK